MDKTVAVQAVSAPQTGRYREACRRTGKSWPPSRRGGGYVTSELMLLALVFVVLVIAGPLRNGVGIAIAIVIAGVSLLVGPRSPFFR